MTMTSKVIDCDPIDLEDDCDAEEFLQQLKRIFGNWQLNPLPASLISNDSKFTGQYLSGDDYSSV